MTWLLTHAACAWSRWRQGGQRPASAGTRTPVAIARPEDRGAGSLFSPATDQTTHTHTHTPNARAYGWQYYPDQPPERRLERDEAFKPQPAHSATTTEEALLQDLVRRL